MAQNEGRTLRRAPKLSTVYLALFVATLCSSLGFGLALHGLKAAAESALAVESSNKSSAQTDLGTNTTQNTASQLVVSSEPVTALQNCTPADYHLPTAIDLTNLPDGLTTIKDSTQRYVVYGDTAEERLQQLQQCAPDGEYAGAASYQITWQYSYGVRSDGLCEIMQPKIGLHLGMIVPDWFAGTTATQTEKSDWNKYIQALTIHELGHHDISRQYAKTMLQRLQAVQPQDCASIKTRVDTVLEAMLLQLQTAQNNYDAITNHGATQGAVL
jgi:predicted secreted Zn-dependent protease